MTYKNPDPGVEIDAQNTANYVAECFENEIERLINNRYYRKNWTVLSTELRLAAIEEINKIFNVKLVEMRQLQRSNDWKYKPQSQTYPDLQKDLRRIYPGLGDYSE